MNLWATVAQAAVGAVVSFTVSRLYGRALRRERARIDRLLEFAEVLVGGTAAITTIKQKGPRVDLQQYRKGIAAGVSAGLGVLLIGLLSWAATLEQLEPILGPMVAEPFRPLVGVLLGGIALTASTTIAVVKARNAPAPGPRRGAATIEEPAPPVVEPEGTAPSAAADATPPADEATAATEAPVYSRPPVTADAAPTFARVPFWEGVQPAAEPSAPTSIVELLPAPARSYQ